MIQTLFLFDLDIPNECIKNSIWMEMPIVAKVDPLSFQRSLILGYWNHSKWCVLKDGIWITELQTDLFHEMKILPNGMMVGNAKDSVVLYDTRLILSEMNWKRMNLHIPVFDIVFEWV